MYCVNRKEPDLELEGLFKRHFTQVEFYQGTVMDANDLHRVSVRTLGTRLVRIRSYVHVPYRTLYTDSLLCVIYSVQSIDITRCIIVEIPGF